MTLYDYLIVGAGPFGATCANELTRAGKSCLVIDRRSHVAGNTYTQEQDGIQLHMYGAHIFHTNSDRIWEYVRKLGTWNNYRHRVLAWPSAQPAWQGANGFYSMPFNETTYRQVWPGITEAQLSVLLNQTLVGVIPPGGTAEDVIPYDDSNIEGWCKRNLPEPLYDMFIKGYTEKQWGKSCAELPSSIIKRIPVRRELNEEYFTDRHQGIPVGGYTRLFEGMLSRSRVKLGVDFTTARGELTRLCHKTIYTGAIDEFFDYCHGRLEYRGVRLEHERLPNWRVFQPCAVVNYTHRDVPFTRIIEHKHFSQTVNPVPTTNEEARALAISPEHEKDRCTWITREYPGSPDPMYPVRDAVNLRRYALYNDMAVRTPRVFFGGRLAEYQYYDMHQVIASALKLTERLLAPT